MWRYIMRIALALVAIATNQMVLCEERCLLLCDQEKIPGPKLQYSLNPCEYNQVCMQKMTYKLNTLTVKDINMRNDAIIYLDRHCIAARKCKEHCRMVTSNIDEKPKIQMCVSCMNSTTFAHDGKRVSEMVCFDDEDPEVEPIDEYDR